MTQMNETPEGPRHPDEPSHHGGNDPECFYCLRDNGPLQVTLSNGTEVETGCYVDGHWGWRGAAHLLECAEELIGYVPSEPIPDDEYSDEYSEAIHYECDRAEQALNDATPEGFLWYWHDGEFFLAPFCGGAGQREDDHDPTCACWE